MVYKADMLASVVGKLNCCNWYTLKIKLCTIETLYALINKRVQHLCNNARIYSRSYNPAYIDSI